MKEAVTTGCSGTSALQLCGKVCGVDWYTSATGMQCIRKTFTAPGEVLLPTLVYNASSAHIKHGFLGD